MWTRRPGSVFLTRIVQSALLLIIILSYFRNVHHSHSPADSAAKHASRQTSRLQNILSLSLFNTSTILGGFLTSPEDEVIKPRNASRISPTELMNRPLPVDRTRAPKLIHQSWKNDKLPPKMQRWATSCREANPDWEYVLWSDADNQELVKKYAPWFFQAYKDLHAEIYRADAVRYIYMHVFGGVYTDLDTECIRSYDTLFNKYNITTAPYLSLNETLPLSSAAQRSTRRAFLGRMGTDEGSIHSIPNAWMASTPGHPFWLLPTEQIKTHVSEGGMPEMLTGPVSLYDEVSYYNSYYHHEGEGLDERYSKSGWKDLYPVENLEELYILPFWMVYPYSWQRDGDPYKDYCLVGKEEFNSTRCKEVLGLDAWGSWSITYWSHSWDSNGGNHVESLGGKKDDEMEKEDEEEESDKMSEWGSSSEMNVDSSDGERHLMTGAIEEGDVSNWPEVDKKHETTDRKATTKGDIAKKKTGNEEAGEGKSRAEKQEDQKKWAENVDRGQNTADEQKPSKKPNEKSKDKNMNDDTTSSSHTFSTADKDDHKDVGGAEPGAFELDTSTEEDKPQETGDDDEKDRTKKEEKEKEKEDQNGKQSEEEIESKADKKDMKDKDKQDVSEKPTAEPESDVQEKQNAAEQKKEDGEFTQRLRGLLDGTETP